MDIDFEYFNVFPSVIEKEDFLRNCYMTDISENEIVLTRNYLCKIKANKRHKDHYSAKTLSSCNVVLECYSVNRY